MNEMRKPAMGRPMSGQARALRTVDDLRAAGLIDPDNRAVLQEVAARYAVSITPAVADLIVPGDAHDPIARQFVPHADESITRDDEDADPIGDDAHSPVAGIVHRYPDRVLLKLTAICAVYCRFCFRREMVGPDSGRALSAAEREAALAYIAATPAIWEVILTGGDPLVLSARRLAEVSRQLATVAHVKVLRVHTRVPIAAPERITPSLLRALRASGKAVYVVVHANHPRELTDEVKAALGHMADAGIALLSQSVLLRGVNDDVETLGALMRNFVESRVKPYYLHHLDHAPGTARFRTSLSSGQQLMRDLHGRYSGLCQPQYVLDIPGGFGKSPIGPNYLRQTGVSVAKVVSGTSDLATDDYEVEDYKGLRHRYRSGV